MLDNVYFPGFSKKVEEVFGVSRMIPFLNLYGFQVFNTLDLYPASHQIPVTLNKTAIINPFRLFEFTEVQFGLCFQRPFNSISTSLDFIFGYIADVLIASKSIEDIDKLRDNVIINNPSICLFYQQELEFVESLNMNCFLQKRRFKQLRISEVYCFEQAHKLH